MNGENDKPESPLARVEPTLDDAVDMFVKFRDRLMDRIADRDEEIRRAASENREARRLVSGRGQRGTAASPGEGTHSARVLGWLAEHPGPHPINEILTGCGLNSPSGRQAVLALFGARQIERPTRGVYQLPLKEVQAEVVPPEVTHTTGTPPRPETAADRRKRMERSRSG